MAAAFSFSHLHSEYLVWYLFKNLASEKKTSNPQASFTGFRNVYWGKIVGTIESAGWLHDEAVLVSTYRVE